MSGMDFFGEQERARRASRWLVLWFALAVLGVASCVHLAAAALLSTQGHDDLWRLDVFVGITCVVLTVIGIGSLWKTVQLRAGGATVATMLGGRLVDPGAQEPGERMLRNVVEEIAIASGVPVPQVFVLDADQGINAFAAGWSTADAAIAVTAGCLQHLNRDELQGIVAHEFSHVFHGDMRLNIRLIGVIAGIVGLATIGRVLLRVRVSGSSKNKGGAAGVVLFGLALVFVGAIGVLFARLIQAAVSRQREFLADASAVQYTRVGSSRVDLQACKLEYSIVSPK